MSASRLRLLRALVAGDQIARVRRGCFALCMVSCASQPLSVLSTPHTAGERTVLLLGILVLAAAYVTGYRRGAFPLPLRLVIVAVVLVMAPLAGAVIVGTAFTSTWLLSCYPGTRPVLMAVAFAAAAVIGQVTAVSGAARADPGTLIGQSLSLCIMALFLNQLRVSLDEREALQRTLTHHAHYDSLTDLPNRRSFHQRLDLAVERYRHFGEPYALLMLDLDDFKRINDERGHEHGDAVLRAVAERIAACVRDSDHCARLGGDEFGVLLENCADAAIAHALADRLTEEISRPVPLGDIAEQVGVSIGVTWSAESATVALRSADTAMYAAKLHRSTLTAVAAT